jgi:hypothetical protein
MVLNTDGGFSASIEDHDYIGSYKSDDGIMNFFLDRIEINGIEFHLNDLRSILVKSEDKLKREGDGIGFEYKNDYFFLKITGGIFPLKDVYTLERLIKKMIFNYKKTY